MIERTTKSTVATVKIRPKAEVQRFKLNRRKQPFAAAGPETVPKV